MLFTVLRPHVPPLAVEADAHAVEGAHHVFRRDTVVLGRARSVVVLRLPVTATTAVTTDLPPAAAPGAGSWSP